jgi:lipocalin-like protein
MRLTFGVAFAGRWMAGAIAFLLLSSASASASAQARLSSLVGTWRFVEITDFDSTGAPIQYFGDKPCGFIIYTATGQVSVHIARCPTPDLSPPELAATYNGYFGTYTVNEARGLVTHLVEGGSAPDYIGTPQQRPFRITGDTLVLGDGQSYKRVLVRVR